jgi:TatD DNase family protein
MAMRIMGKLLLLYNGFAANDLPGLSTEKKSRLSLLPPSAWAMMLIDSHCHLDVDDFAADRDAVLARCVSSGIGAVIVPGVRLHDFGNQRAVCASSPLLFAAYGLHPVFLAEHGSSDVNALREWIAREQPVAVGEIGLDFFVETLDRQRQQALFEQQLLLAREFDLPVILHVRRSHDAVLSTLRRFRLPRGGICHAFAGSPQQARQYLDLGFLLGFGGAATFARANRLRGTLRALPADALALETDAPDIPPCFVEKGGRNSPDFLPRIAGILAEVRGEPVEKLVADTTRNVLKLLRLPLAT